MSRRKYSDEQLDLLARQVIQKAEILYEAAPGAHAPGHAWYYEAHNTAKRMARELDIDVRFTSAAMAVLSPQIAWQDAVLDAWKVGWGDTTGFMALPENVAKAYTVIHEARFHRVRGKKVTRFWANILNPYESLDVTLDTHMANMFNVPAMDLFERSLVYETVELAIQDVAQDRGIQPHQLQATLWIAYKGYGRNVPVLEPTGKEF